MTMPIDLVLVRHGESEGNRAYSLSNRGDQRYFMPGSAFLERHNSQWRLTARGQEQARAAGAWIRRHLSTDFDRYMVAEYLRAMETAGHLGFPNARWYCDFFLRERDWGKFDVMSTEQRKRDYADELQRRERDRFFWSPPGGESMATVCLRIDRVLYTLHRECADKRALIVCHGEVMWAFRVRLERMSQVEYHHLDLSTSPLDKIHNGQVLHYTRRDPATGQVGPYLDWRRSICPWDPTLSSNDWQAIQRKRYSNEELLAVVEQTPRVVADG